MAGTFSDFTIRIAGQFEKMLRNQREEREYEQYFDAVFEFESRYALDSDANLNDEQIAEIDRFWGKYSFAYPRISYNAFKVYMNRTGIFSPLYIPKGIRPKFIGPMLVNEQYKISLQNKVYLPKLLTGIRQPKMLVCRINGYYFNGAYERINLSKAIQICQAHLKAGNELILKPNGGNGGGHGVQLFKSATDAKLENAFERTGRTFVVQDVLKQSVDMARFNPSSINTIRITSMIENNHVVILCALLRVGAPKRRVDNWSSGGMIIGAMPNGQLLPWGSKKKDCNRTTTLPGGVQLSPETPLFVPGWDEAINLVKRAHIQVPYVKLAGWDIAIEEDGLPTCIEVNFGNDITMHQLLTGPVFGDYTERLLDRAILQNYYKKRSNFSFDFREYHDHVEIEKYVGRSRKVVCPKTFRNKPVTAICANAFRWNTAIECVVLPESIVRIGTRAFSGCERLTDINVPPNAALGQLAFFKCPLRNETLK